MSVITGTLSTPDRERFAELEEIIERNIKSFIEAGNALWEIRDSGYYRITHKSFESYCSERWGFGSTHAYRLIRSAKVVGRIANTPQVTEEVCPIGHTSAIPTTESQVRELAKAPKDEQAEVWQEVIETTAKPTAAAVKAVVEKRKAKQADTESADNSLPNGGKVYRHDAPMPEWYADDNGVAVPLELYPVWRAKNRYSMLCDEPRNFDTCRLLREIGEELGHQATIDMAKELHDDIAKFGMMFRQKIGSVQPSVVIAGEWKSRSEVATNG